ncbi:hypothetical protein HJC23_005935 [Cyclotella cryptica]|uniref:Abnormal spindle-like microcephaly-associated protein n=1 Tax=Cyclotella cryptica TaxID=29204 RepID=A0ABD3R4W6_9STRA|eukprot:CCRYP_000510-RA/>CCRYP_000510-RA protein AED:0.02 eAED:0.02 QI:184/1/1/1/0.9/0.81/11/384/1402
MNYEHQQRDDNENTMAIFRRNTNNKPYRLRELARLRSLSIQPLSPSKNCGKHIRGDSFACTENVESADFVVKNLEDGVKGSSIFRFPSQQAVESRLPKNTTPVNVVEFRHGPPSSPSQSHMTSQLTSPDAGVPTILDSPRMKKLRMQIQQRNGRPSSNDRRSVERREPVNASLRRAQIHRRGASISGHRDSDGRSTSVDVKPSAPAKADLTASASSAMSFRGQRHRSVGRSPIFIPNARNPPKEESTTSASLRRAHHHRRNASIASERSAITTATKPRNRPALPTQTSQRSSSPSQPNRKYESNTNLALELNDSDIFTDFHLLTMAASSDSSLATNSSGGSHSQSERRKKLMGRKFKSISKSNPSHHTIIAKLVTQKSKKKNSYVPIRQLCQYVVPIQTLARVYLSKRAASKRMSRIVILQSLVRRWRCERYLSKCKFIALQMQACHRGYIARKEVVCLHASTYVATRMQAHYRGSVVRSALRYENYCVTRIQASWRGYWEYVSYGDMLNSAILLQSIARMRPHRKMFLFVQNARLALEASMQAAKEEEAAIKIQSFWRTSFCRLEFCNVIIDIVIVQSVVRRWSGNRLAKQMQKEHHAATKIQSWVRGRSEYLDFMLVLAATITIQSCIRRDQAIKQLEQRKEERYQMESMSATKITVCWRRFAARKNYFNILIDVIICQSVARRFSAMKRVNALKLEQERVRALLVIACATLIQRSWRESRIDKVKTNMIRLERTEWSAVTKIARTWRRFACRDDYRLTVEGIITCQKLVRRFLATGKVKLLMREKRVASTIIIQAAWRRRLAIIKCSRSVLKIVALQSIIRRWMATRIFQQLISERQRCKRSAATVMQSLWRRFYCSKKFHGVVRDVVICQSLVRRMIILKNTRQIHRATLIQSIIRRWMASKRVAELAREKWQKEMAAATRIQTSWRSFYCNRDFMVTLGDIIICQSVVRCHIASRKAYALRQELKHAKNLLKILCNMKGLEMVEQTSATKISSVIRRFGCQREYRNIQAAVRICQTVTRNFLSAKKVELKVQQDVIICQSIARRKLACLKANFTRQQIHREQMFANMKCLACTERSASTIIAAKWRTVVCRTTFVFSLKRVVVCQSVARRVIAKRKVDCLVHRKLVACATLIQASWRMHLAIIAVVKNVHEMRCTYATLIQKSWRRYHAIVEYKQALLELADIKAAAATRISSCWRGFVTRTACVDVLIGIILFQSLFRRMSAMKKTEALRQRRLQASATVIQARWRGHISMIRFTWKMYDIILVQSLARRWIASRRADELGQKRFQTEMAAATKIQSHWRSFYKYTEYMITLGDVILCQSVIRRHFASRKAYELRQEYQQAGNLIQILCNMKELMAVEQASATKIARTWRRMRKTRLTRMVAAWRTLCVQEKRCTR